MSTNDINEVVSDAERLSAFYANATYDFYGTPSGALCSQRIIREARSVYDHPVKATWRAVGERICNLLDNKKVFWTSIDPLAFAEAGKKTFSPLLLWIGVQPASLSYGDANTAAEAVMFLLAEAGFSGIEIGFRESIVTRSLCKPFTPTLGLSIATLNTPHFEGTGALYLRESKESKRVFLLTCAHVACPPPVRRNTGLPRKTKSHRREKVVALGNMGYTNAIERMMATIATQHQLIRDWEAVLRRLGEPEEGGEQHVSDIRNEHLALVEKAKKTIDHANKFHNQITKYWTTPKQRIIGEVAHVEPIAVHVEPSHFTRDWALIELYEEKFDWTTFRGNKVYVGGNLPSADYANIMFPRPEDRVDYQYPEDGLLQAFGVVKPHEIHNPQHLDVNGEKCLLVVKNGLATGTTIGRATGMESFTRVYNEHGITDTSIELAVLPYGNTKGAFSAPGDSGSIVLDRDGRILGMLTGGAGTDERTDEQIKKMFPDCYLYEVIE
ncbi:hypothetical protein V8D89_005491 [Ganoderma adspersum]